MNHIVMVTADPMPSPRANGVQTVHTAAALAALGNRVTLLAAKPAADVPTVFDAYDLPHSFMVKTLPSWHPPHHFPQRKRIASFTMLPSLLISLLALRLGGQLVVYSREDHFTGYLLWLLRRLPGVSVFFEAHYFPPTRRNLHWQTRLDGIVAITHPLRQAYLDAGVPPEKLSVAPDGVAVERFAPQLSKSEARSALRVDDGRPLIVYTGHLFAWKGVFVLAEAMRHLPEARCLIVGGLPQDKGALAHFLATEKISNVELIGQVAATAVPPYLWASDVLVLPNSGKKAISRLYTSPLKLFEYMAAQRPIVASDLPSLRDVLHHGENAHLVPADNAKALADGIKVVLDNPTYAARLSKRAAQDVTAYSWENRARRIVAFVEPRL